MTEQIGQKVVGKVLGQAGGRPVNTSKLYSFKIATPEGERTFGTFDEKLADELRQGLDNTYDITYYDDPYTAKDGTPRSTRKFITALPADPSSFGAQPDSNAAYQPASGPTTPIPAPISMGGTQPGRTWDESKDIERMSIERQTSLKAAVDMLKGTDTPELLLATIDWADGFYAWLRNPPLQAPGDPVAPVPSPQGTQAPSGEGDWPPELPSATAEVDVPTNYQTFWPAATARGKTSQDVQNALGAPLQSYIGAAETPKQFGEAWAKCLEVWNAAAR